MSAESLHVIYGKALDERLTEQNAVLVECLEVAMRELSFGDIPTARVALRKIRQRLASAKLEVKA